MEKTNILYIVCHDLGRCLNAYDRSPIKSPNLDRLASEGIRFANHFCSSPYCSPSRGAITTGRYPHSNGLEGLVNLGWDLSGAEVTTPMHLKKAGYETYLFGGQHECSDPNRLGYDHVDVNRPRTEYAQTIADFLNAKPETPFYLNYFIHEPHRPFLDPGPVLPSELYGRPNYDDYDDPGNDVWIPPYLPKHEVVRKEMAGFQRLVKTMDNYVGTVLDGLDRSGLAENTLVIFTTDHGIDMPRAKGTLYDPGIETTMIMRWPGHIKSGTVSDELLSHVDLLPTLMDIIGIDVPENVHGHSYQPLLTGETYTPREEIYAELGDIDPMRCIRIKSHKLIFNVRSHKSIGFPSLSHMDLISTVPEYLTHCRPLAELYDLENDPLEQNNLWNDPAHKGVQDDLKSRLYQWMKATGDPLLDGIVVTPNLIAAI